MAFPGRHRFQVGPSTFSLRQEPDGGWWVHEVWWQITNHNGDKDDTFWDYGPFGSEGEAFRLQEGLKAIREKRT